MPGQRPVGLVARALAAPRGDQAGEADDPGVREPACDERGFTLIEIRHRPGRHAALLVRRRQDDDA